MLVSARARPFNNFVARDGVRIAIYDCVFSCPLFFLRFAGAETGGWPRQNDGSAGEEQYVALRLPQPCQLQRQRAFLRRIRWYVKNYDSALITLYSVRIILYVRMCQSAKTSFWPLDQRLTGCANFDTGINLIFYKELLLTMLYLYIFQMHE